MISNHIINLSNKAAVRTLSNQIADHYPAHSYQDKILTRIYEEMLDKMLDKKKVHHDVTGIIPFSRSW